MRAENIDGIVVDENGAPLPYSTVRILGKRLAVLGDSVGKFDLQIKKVDDKDTLTISYLGYETEKIAISQLEMGKSSCFQLRPIASMLNEVAVSPKIKSKVKIKKQGKKHSWAFMKSCLDGEVAGDCFGYEFHSKKNKRLILDRVGFFYCEGEGQIKDALSGKFEYILPEGIVLPKDAMVEIEFLENLNGEFFYFKSNLIGRRTWSKSILDGEWERNPFSTPFFVECVEVKE